MDSNFQLGILGGKTVFPLLHCIGLLGEVIFINLIKMFPGKKKPDKMLIKTGS